MEASQRAIKKQQDDLVTVREQHKNQLKYQQQIADQKVAEQQRKQAKLEAKRQQQEQDRIAEERSRTDERARQEIKLKMLQGIP